MAFLSTAEQELNEDLKSIFNQDFPAVASDSRVLSQQARYAHEQLKSSIKWNELEGKYSVGLPYKFGREKTAELLNSVNSSDMARKRMFSHIYLEVAHHGLSLRLCCLNMVTG